MSLDIDKLADLAESARGGGDDDDPWFEEHELVGSILTSDESETIIHEWSAAFMAAASPDVVLALVEEVRWLRSALTVAPTVAPSEVAALLCRDVGGAHEVVLNADTTAGKNVYLAQTTGAAIDQFGLVMTPQRALELARALERAAWKAGAR